MKIVRTRMAASRRHITFNFIYVAWDLHPREYNLHATGGHTGTIWMQLAASLMQFYHMLAASTVQSSEFFERTLLEQLFHLKTEEAI